MNTSFLQSLSRGPARLALSAVMVAVVGSVTLAAHAAPDGRHGSHGSHGGMGMPMMGGMQVDRMLDGVNASAEQRTQIQQIMASASADLKTQREGGRGLREQAMKLFTQPDVDATAAEALRLQMLAQHDQASKRTMQAMLDASRVLTPEQRKQMTERMGQRRGMMDRQRAERDGTAQPAR